MSERNGMIEQFGPCRRLVEQNGAVVWEFGHYSRRQRALFLAGGALMLTLIVPVWLLGPIPPVQSVAKTIAITIMILWPFLAVCVATLRVVRTDPGGYAWRLRVLGVEILRRRLRPVDLATIDLDHIKPGVPPPPPPGFLLTVCLQSGSKIYLQHFREENESLAARVFDQVKLDLSATEPTRSR